MKKFYYRKNVNEDEIHILEGKNKTICQKDINELEKIDFANYIPIQILDDICDRYVNSNITINKSEICSDKLTDKTEESVRIISALLGRHLCADCIKTFYKTLNK